MENPRALSEYDKTKLIMEDTVELLSSKLFTSDYNLNVIMITWGSFTILKNEGEINNVHCLFDTIFHEPWTVEVTTKYFTFYKDKPSLRICINDLDKSAKEGINLLLERNDKVKYEALAFFRQTDDPMSFSDEIHLSCFRYTAQLRKHFDVGKVIKILLVRAMGTAILHKCFLEMRTTLLAAFGLIQYDYYLDRNDEKYTDKQKNLKIIIELTMLLQHKSTEIYDIITKALEKQRKNNQKAIKNSTKTIEDSFKFQYELEEKPPMIDYYESFLQINNM